MQPPPNFLQINDGSSTDIVELDRPHFLPISVYSQFESAAPPIFSR